MLLRLEHVRLICGVVVFCLLCTGIAGGAAALELPPAPTVPARTVPAVTLPAPPSPVRVVPPSPPAVTVTAPKAPPAPQTPQAPQAPPPPKVQNVATNPVATTPAATTAAPAAPRTPSTDPAPPAQRPSTQPAAPAQSGGAPVQQSGPSDPGGSVASDPTSGSQQSSSHASRATTAKTFLSRARPRFSILVRFHLAARTRIKLSVDQLAPSCRPFAVLGRTGHKGTNALWLRLRVGKRTLTPGTYRLTVRSATRRVLVRRFVVVASGQPTRRALLAASKKNACRASTRPTVVSAVADQAVQSDVARQSTFRPAPNAAGTRASAAGDGARPTEPGISRFLPAPSRFLPAPLARQIDQSPAWLRPIWVALLVADILLLGAAAIPQRLIVGGRALSVIERRRLALAMAGIAIVVAVAIGLILS
jgi:hypothetical protein